MAGYIGSKSSVTQVDGYSEAEADAEFVNDPNGAITVSGSNVGIGTSSPSYTLDVYKSSVGDVARFNSTSGNRSLDITSADNGAYLGAEWDRNINSAGGIHTWSVNDTERMRIDSSGNVGIGTSSPSATLQVVGTTNSLQSVFGSDSSGLKISTFQKTANDAGVILDAQESSNGTLTFATTGTERMRIDSSGRLMLGTTAPFSGSNGSLYIETDAVVSRNLIAMNNTGSGTNAAGVVALYRRQNFTGGITNTFTSTSFNTSSDYRLKENVVDLTGASARINQLNPSRFNFIADADKTVDGFLAHEVADVVPEAVTGTKDAMMDEEYEVTPAVEATYDEDGNELTAAVEAVMGTRSVPDYQGIDQSKLVPLLTAALQEALAEITSLKTRVQALEDV
jgi:hypothetical protein